MRMIEKKRPAIPQKERTGHHGPEGPQQSKPTQEQKKIQEAIDTFLLNEKPLFAHLIGEDALENLLKRFISHLNKNGLDLVTTSDLVTVSYRYLAFHSRLS